MVRGKIQSALQQNVAHQRAGEICGRVAVSRKDCTTVCSTVCRDDVKVVISKSSNFVLIQFKHSKTVCPGALSMKIY